nr:LysM domain-containing protein [Neobacillus niacini]
MTLATLLLIGNPTFAYTVEVGDTMSEIAEENGLTLQELSKANSQIQKINLIYVGQKLNTIASSEII